MSNKGPGSQQRRYEVITQQDEKTGDLLLPIPPVLLEKMGWREGDDIDFTVDDTGRLVLKKKTK